MIDNKNGQLRVLVVDDEGVTRELVRTILHSLQHEVVAEAMDGPTALQLCRALRPDIVFLDIQLRHSNGLETLAKIRAELPEIAVIMLTGEAFPDVIRQAKEKGACDFIVKPFSGEVVRRAIERCAGIAATP